MVQEDKIFQEGTSTLFLPPNTFRAYGYRTFALCQYNYRMCWCYRKSFKLKKFIRSGNNFVKVWRKRPLRRRSKGCGDGPTPNFSNFYHVFKNNAFTACFGLKFLPKNILVKRNNIVVTDNQVASLLNP